MSVSASVNASAKAEARTPSSRPWRADGLQLPRESSGSIGTTVTTAVGGGFADVAGEISDWKGDVNQGEGRLEGGRFLGDEGV